MICLGIEGTAEKLGVGIVEGSGKILANLGRQFLPPVGGIHPREASQHHSHYLPELLKNAIKKAEINPGEIDLVSFPKGPGLGPCLRTVATAARSISLLLDIPIVGVNHCIAHIEIGILRTGLKDPVSNPIRKRCQYTGDCICRQKVSSVWRNFRRRSGQLLR